VYLQLSSSKVKRATHQATTQPPSTPAPRQRYKAESKAIFLLTPQPSPFNRQPAGLGAPARQMQRMREQALSAGLARCPKCRSRDVSSSTGLERCPKCRSRERRHGGLERCVLYVLYLRQIYPRVQKDISSCSETCIVLLKHLRVVEPLTNSSPSYPHYVTPNDLQRED